MQKPVSGSTTQILTQGVSIFGWFIMFMDRRILIARAARRMETPLGGSKASFVRA
jgi:hypothetical protein